MHTGYAATRYINLSHTPHPYLLISVPYPLYLSHTLISVPYPSIVLYPLMISVLYPPYTSHTPHICPIPLIIEGNLAMHTLLCCAFSSPCSNLLMMDPPSSNETSLSTVGTLKLDIAPPSWSDARTCSSSWGRSSHSWSHDQICHGTVGKNKALVMFEVLV